MSPKLVTVFIFACLLSVLGTCGRAPMNGERPTSELRKAYERPPAEWPAPTLDPGVEHRELGILKREQAIPVTAEVKRMVRSEKALAKLGKQLFFDPILSESNQVSCASCHDPDLAWGDGRRRAFGHDRDRRAANAMRRPC